MNDLNATSQALLAGIEKLDSFGLATCDLRVVTATVSETKQTELET